MYVQFLLIVAILCSAEDRTESKSTCSAPSVFEKQPANISFHFSDIGEMKKDFIFRHYKEGSLEAEIMDCDWKLKVRRNCNVKPSGYDYVLNGTTLILKIESAAARHEGTYICQETGLPPDPHSQSCNFTLKAAEETSSTSSTSSTFSASSTSSQSSASSTSSAVRRREEPKDDSTLLIAVPAVLGVILVAAVVVIFICRKRLFARYRQCRNRNEESGVSFSNSAGGNGSVVGDEQSAPMLDETTAPTENEATMSESSVQPASGEVTIENTSEESPLIQPSNKKHVDNSPIGAALKALDETGVVIIAGAEKIEKTKIGQDLLQYYRGKEYEQIQLHNLRQWLQYVTNRDKKYLIVIGEAITNDPNVSEHAWSSFLRHVRERQCPVVITVRSNEKLEESAKAGLFQSIPVVLAEVKSDVKAVRSSSRGDVAPSCEGISPGVQIDKGQAEHTEAHDRHSSSENLTNSRQEEETFDLVIFDVPESKKKNPSAAFEEETRIMEDMLKETGISDIELTEVTYVRRYGEPKSDVTPRPLIISVQSKATKDKILQKAKEMNQETGAHGMRLKICVYKPRSEREREKEIERERKREKEREKEEEKEEECMSSEES